MGYRRIQSLGRYQREGVAVGAICDGWHYRRGFRDMHGSGAHVACASCIFESHQGDVPVSQIKAELLLIYPDDLVSVLEFLEKSCLERPRRLIKQIRVPGQAAMTAVKHRLHCAVVKGLRITVVGLPSSAPQPLRSLIMSTKRHRSILWAPKFKLFKIQGFPSNQSPLLTSGLTGLLRSPPGILSCHGLFKPRHPPITGYRFLVS
jgi:hypothetical protein